MYTATVIRWGDDRAWIQHPGIGDCMFWISDADTRLRSNWTSIRGRLVKYDLENGQVKNVRPA